MANPKNVLVITTSSVDGLKIKKYLKPVSAHIVAGTNLFNDFFGGLTDVFGGRSQTYQKQLTSLYDEAIERIKHAACEIGANCVVGLNIDMDEISGKGKSMFMLTAIGTAVVLEKDVEKTMEKSTEEFDIVGVDRINVLRDKKAIIEKANAGNLILNDEIWNFLTVNQVDQVFIFLLKKFASTKSNDEIVQGLSANFYKMFIGYIDNLPEQAKLDGLYNGIKDENNEDVALKLSEIIKELRLFDFHRSMKLLKNSDFRIQKRGLLVASYDKPFYNKQDKQELQTIKDCISQTFIERGTRSSKKQLLSSKEKQVWICECGKTNDIDTYCSGCNQDIYGFKQTEMKPLTVDNYIQQKIELISEFID
ncbi:MAG: YbjQ family protein [Sphingobacteriaceae bacterium]